TLSAGEDPLRFLELWGAVFAVSLAFQVGASLRRARWTGEPFWSSLVIEIVHALWPPFVVALVLTGLLFDRGVPDLIPVTWVLCYGIGALAAARHHREVGWLGLAFLVTGALYAVTPVSDALLLGVSFCVHHLLFGLLLAWRRAA
ncbi:MAG: hypothetical protein KDC38_20810, partial [Planctomycetes bacterium]|nr:hypothetical protein [Planctomycetota bacterium]